MNTHSVKTTHGTEITNPPIARLLFDDTRFSVVWLVVRVLLGLTWLQASLHKLGDAGWMQTGDVLKGFWTRAVIIPNAPAQPAIAFDWYRSFIQGMLDSGSYVWFAKLVAFGELFIGLGMIFGCFVGIAAFFGGLLNWTFIMAGTASTNPVLMVAAIALMMAWKTAGWYGIDRFLLPRLGTPWRAGRTAAPPINAVLPAPHGA